MPLKIVQVGEPVLRRKGRILKPAAIRSREIQNLIAAMRETMYEAPGVGLAAPQIGQDLQIAVIEDKAEYVKDVPPEILADRERKPVPFHVIINPKIELQVGQTKAFYEGCLSLAGFTALVPRARSVTVHCLDHNGKEQTIRAAGWYARILQHEIDHLFGTLYIDRMQSRTFSTLDNYSAVSKGRTTAELQTLYNED